MSFVDEYVRWTTPSCDAPEIYQRYCALVLLAAIVGRKLRYSSGLRTIHANIWVLLMGDSGDRKTTPMAFAMDLLREHNLAYIYPDEFSYKRYIETARDNPGGVIKVSEYTKFVKMLNQSYNDGLLSLLTELYDSPHVYTREISGKEYTIRSPAVSIIACTTPQHMETSMSEWQSGWGQRFLTVPGRRDHVKPLPPAPDPTTKARMLRFLHNCRTLPNVIYMDLEDEELYSEWVKRYDGMNDMRTTLERSCASRLTTTCLKLAMLYEIANQRKFFTDDWYWPADPTVWSRMKISSLSLREAILQIEMLTAMQSHAIRSSIMMQTSFDKKLSKVLEAVKAQTGDEAKPVLRSALMRAAGMPQADLDKCIEELIGRRMLDREEVKRDSGHISQVYRVLPLVEMKETEIATRARESLNALRDAYEGSDQLMQSAAPRAESNGLPPWRPPPKPHRLD